MISACARPIANSFEDYPLLNSWHMLMSQKEMYGYCTHEISNKCKIGTVIEEKYKVL